MVTLEKQTMELNRIVISLTIIVAGVTLSIISLAVLLVNISSPVVLDALKTIGSPDFVLLQQDIDYTLAIIGVAVSAALAIGIPAVGASLGMATASAAALGAITERPEIFGKTVLYVVFIEAIAIYGFVIAFLLTGYIPSMIG
jgi:V/A-type H+-transporting ATPase subunit K